MARQITNNIKLGVFVLSGLLILIVALYMIGKDSNLFGRNYTLKARFENVQGLTAGNNVRYAGIQVGTVRSVKILNDTVIEVTMLISKKMQSFIHKADIVSIGTDGLMGNKLINIIPSKNGSPLAVKNDILLTRRSIRTEEMMETLSRTNNNLELITEDIMKTVQQINSSTALWRILNEQSLPNNLASSMANIRMATVGTNELISELQEIIHAVKNGEGSLGMILRDTSIAYGLNQALAKIQSVGDKTNALADQLSLLAAEVRQEVSHGDGAVSALLKDSTIVNKISNSLSNIQSATASFNESMDALKHNFLLRGYFRKKEKQAKKEATAQDRLANKP
jgi:phospholipid/cholesterol/gamma-HCH transport system substrate-binding protein